MTLLLFSYERQQIIERKSVINKRLLDLNQRLMALQSYAASLGDGKITMNELMNAPSPLFGRMCAYAKTSNSVAEAKAIQEARQMYALNQPMMMAQVQASMPNKAQQDWYFKAYFQELVRERKEKELEDFKKQEENILNNEDKKIESEKAKLETQLKMLDAMEETVKKGEEDGAKKSAPQFVA